MASDLHLWQNNRIFVLVFSRQNAFQNRFGAIKKHLPATRVFFCTSTCSPSRP